MLFLICASWTRSVTFPTSQPTRTDLIKPQISTETLNAQKLANTLNSQKWYNDLKNQNHCSHIGPL